jgi:hypothetical protein
MAKYRVNMQTLVTIEVDSPSPEMAAQYARDRIMGLLRETPAEVQAIGFMPHYVWTVVEGKTLVATGQDNDLSPRSGAMSTD